jgi:drug/metabolite transporter (DMT)-like permease
LTSGRLKGGPFLYALLFLVMLGWAGNYIATKVALQYLPPLLLFGIRISMAAVLMLPVYVWYRRSHPPTWRLNDLPLLIAIGIFGVSLNQFFFVLGMSRTSILHTAIFANMSPFLVLIMVSATGMEKFSAHKFVGVAVALAGVVLLRVADSQPRGQSTFSGDLITFLGALAFAIFMVLGKPTANQYGSISVNTIAYVGGAIMMAPVTIGQSASFPLASLPAVAWLSVFYMALVSSVLAYLVYYYALARMEASRLAAFNYLLPVEATLLGVWLLGEHITAWAAVAGVIIFSGIYMVERAR